MNLGNRGWTKVAAAVVAIGGITTALASASAPAAQAPVVQLSATVGGVQYDIDVTNLQGQNGVEATLRVLVPNPGGPALEQTWATTIVTPPGLEPAATGVALGASLAALASGDGNQVEADVKPRRVPPFMAIIVKNKPQPKRVEVPPPLVVEAAYWQIKSSLALEADTADGRAMAEAFDDTVKLFALAPDVCDQGGGGGGGATCDDGIKNGEESDIDCGGGACLACTTGKVCRFASDCQSKACTGGTCQP